MLCAGCRPSPSKTALLLTSALRREMLASAHLTEKKLKALGKVPAHCPGATRESADSDPLVPGRDAGQL